MSSQAGDEGKQTEQILRRVEEMGERTTVVVSLSPRWKIRSVRSESLYIYSNLCVIKLMIKGAILFLLLKKSNKMTKTNYDSILTSIVCVAKG